MTAKIKIGFYDDASIQAVVEKQTFQQQIDMAADDLQTMIEDRDRWKERALEAERKLAEVLS